MLRVGVAGESGWGLGTAAEEPECTPALRRDPALALPTNTVANSHLLSFSHKNKYFSP